MDRGLLRAYAGGLTALALAGTWLGVASRYPGPQATPTAAETSAVPSGDPAQADLALARAYREAAVRVADSAERRAAAARAAAPAVTVVQAPPVVATRSS